ncbi:NYN domain-containing protein [Gemmiger formicilis]|uniref:translation factor GTPase family protein n=1 Tax=Gemmiger formicilis TaxID=745368 RepID=UPI001956B0F3|nr:TetM/TetW/TetO/TetS family tetracycline resistance ribosomal protection protein [Gemmiger formicilis]MBM6898707.1 NYN domain-containing protein [Gemmiger formicilis]
MAKQTGESPRKQICVGLLAHVDSGKTTLAEGMLYRAGVLRKLGRVDHRDAFLDTDAQERARGITIFAKQAVLTLPAGPDAEETELTLLDTPGHVDFSAEAERALQVLDYAVLVISGTDGVQAHTETLWKLLARYRVPTFVFVNKMDLPGADAAVRLRELRGRFGDGCVDFTGEPDAEALALCSEPLMEEVLADGAPQHDTLITAIARRQVFPCFFGAALRLDGIDRLLQGLQTLTRMPPVWPEFGARVFKVSQDETGTRLTWLKVTGGQLPVKAVLPGGEKADALRLYNGSKFRLVSVATPGMVVAVAGPSATRPGQGLGAEADAEAPLLEPVLNYRADCPDADPHTLLKALQTLEQEDPQLHVAWRDDLAEVHVQLMGEVQLEILQTLLQSRFGLHVTFSEGGILYKETITAAVEGIGHYEPLRHYAEVHLLLEPGPRGSGVQLAADCPPDSLAENWQRLVLTHLAERTHPGVLTGAPLTDVKITLAAGRAHLKHTEGGDFRQATYRAVRQGLRTAQSKNAVQLLEPWYDFTLEVPADAIGRAMADIQRMCGTFDPPETLGDTARLTGRLPVATSRGYAREIASYTHGLGRWAVLPAGYDACHNAEEVIAAAGYDADADVENPADSVFCSHGAGYNVKWDEVPAKAHVDNGLARRLAPAGQPEPEEDGDGTARRRRADAYRGTLEQDKELLAIFERTYGKIRHRGKNGTDAKKAARAALHTTPAAAAPAKPQPTGPDYLLVDGYNVIFAWEDLHRIAQENLDAARRRLMDILCNYAGYKRCIPILVFDAYKVRGGVREVEKYHNLYVVYTKEAETADMYIERATHELAKERRTRVVSSDGAEQVIVLGHGALRVSARAFAEEVAAIEKEIREFLQQ